MQPEPSSSKSRHAGAARPGPAAVRVSRVTALGGHRAVDRFVRWHFGIATEHPRAA
jgi:hypothetical protein